MFKQLSIAGAALAMGLTAMVPTSADAQRYYGDRYERASDNSYRDGYRQNRRHNRNNVYRSQRRCDAGTGGTVIGALAGGLLGHEVAGRGDRTLGAVLGAVGGGLAGRAIDRSDNPRRCR